MLHALMIAWIPDMDPGFWSGGGGRPQLPVPLLSFFGCFRKKQVQVVLETLMDASCFNDSGPGFQMWIQDFGQEGGGRPEPELSIPLP